MAGVTVIAFKEAGSKHYCQLIILKLRPSGSSRASVITTLHKYAELVLIVPFFRCGNRAKKMKYIRLRTYHWLAIAQEWRPGLVQGFFNELNLICIWGAHQCRQDTVLDVLPSCPNFWKPTIPQNPSGAAQLCILGFVILDPVARWHPSQTSLCFTVRCNWFALVCS